MEADLRMPENLGAARVAGGKQYLAMKRAMDVAMSLVMIAVASPLWLAIALAIKLESRGPVFFKQERVGEGGRLFKMYKFRSMVAGADSASHQEDFRQYAQGKPLDQDEHAPLFKKSTDPRVTRVGKFLRAIDMDELPQFINVLKGDMSIVGPRPAIAYELEHYEKSYHDRVTVPQGITGLWQVKARNRVDLRGMVELDLEYIERRSISLDLQLMVLSLPAMLMRPKSNPSTKNGRKS